MNEKEQLKPLLDRLRLTLIRDTADEMTDKAVKGNWSYSQFLKTILSLEVENRNQKLISKIIKRSGINPMKTLESFDFSFNKKIPEKIIKEIAEVKFIDEAENIFFIGASGIGKSHLANAIGFEACMKHYNVIYKRLNDLLDYLHAGNGDMTFEKRYKEIINCPLLIIDDFGLNKLPEKYQIYLYEIMNDRYEKKATIITSNKAFNEWINIFDNPLMANAFVDRIIHNAIIINIDEGESYRKKLFDEKQKKVFNGII